MGRDDLLIYKKYHMTAPILLVITSAATLLASSRMVPVPLRNAYRVTWVDFQPWERDWVRMKRPHGAVVFFQGNRSSILFYRNWGHSEGRQLVKIASDEYDPEFWKACCDAWFAHPCRDACLMLDDMTRFYAEAESA